MPLDFDVAAAQAALDPQLHGVYWEVVFGVRDGLRAGGTLRIRLRMDMCRSRQ